MPATCWCVLELPHTLNSRNKLASVANLLESDLLGCVPLVGTKGERRLVVVFDDDDVGDDDDDENGRLVF